MKLRGKTLIIIGATTLLLIVALHITAERLMLNIAASTEEEDTSENVDRFLGALSHEIDQLNSTVRDYAWWDDTYAFIENANPDYVTLNLVDATFINLRLNVMVFVNSSGQVVFEKAINLTDQTEILVPQSLLDQLATQDLLWKHEDIGSCVAGSVLLSECPMIVASRPILKSESEGPIRGALIMGRFLDRMELDYLNETVHLPLVMQVLGEPWLSSDFQTANSSLSKTGPIFTQTLSVATVAGYTLLKDVYGNPILIFRLDMPRYMYSKIQASLTMFEMLIVGVGLVFAIVTVSLLERFVLSRLNKLSTSVSRVGASRDTSVRVSVTGKDEMTSLASEINNMLVRLGQSEEKLKEERDKVQTYLGIAGVMILVLNADRKVALLNRKGCEILECNVEEALGKDWFNTFLPNKVKEQVSDIFGLLMKGKLEQGTALEYNENPVLTRSGKERLIAWHNTVIKDSGGRIVGTLSSGLDITERKEVEEKLRESEEKFRGIAERSFDAIAIVDLEGRISYASPSVGLVLGYPQKEVIGKSFLEYFSPVELSSATRLFTDLMQGKKLEALQLNLKRREGTTATLEINASPVIIDGEVTGIQAVFRDITERKKMEDALRESEEKIRNILESSPDAITVSDLNGTITDCNQATLQMLGYSSKEEVVRRNAFAFIARKDHEKTMQIMKEVLEQGSVRNFEYSTVAKDGHEFPTEASVSVVRDARGSPRHLVGIIKDITERKRMEEQLRESEERFRSIAERSFDAIMNIDLEGNVTFVSIITEKIIGYKPEEIAGKSFRTFITESWIPKAVQAFAEVTSGKSVRGLELELVRKDGSLVPIEINGAPIIKDGKIVGVQTTARDVTERKRMEDALRDSEERFRAISTSATDIIVLMSSDGIISYWNPAAEKAFGYAQEEVVGKPAMDFLVPKEFRQNMDQGLEEFGKTGGGPVVGTILELITTRKDGTSFPMELSISSFQMKGQWHVLGIARDVTERKKIENKLEQTNKRLQALLQTAREGIVTADPLDNVTFANKAFADILGYTEEELLGLNLRKLVDAQGLERIVGETESRKAGKISRYELVLYRKDGEARTVQVTASPLWNEDGSFAGSLGIMMDATERKMMEEKIKESEERLRRFIEFAPDAIYVNDLDGNFVEGNRQAEEMTGYTKEEIIGKNMLEVGLLSEKYLPKALEALEKNLRGERTGPDEFELTKKDGSKITVEISTFPLKRAGNVEILGIARDITERKKMENALLESEEKIRNILQSSPDAILVSDLNGNAIECNQASLNVFGVVKKEDLIGRGALEFVAAKDKERLLEDLVKVAEQGSIRNVEYTFKDANGREFPAEASASVLRDASGNPRYFVVIMEDITERKQMLMKLEEYSQQLEQMVEKRTHQLRETQEQLVKAERLAAIGQVAAMVGHDLRNPLTGIKGAAYYLKTKPALKADKKTMEMLQLIEKDVEYSNKIITDLLEYSREIHLELTEATPKSIITETLSLLEVPTNVQVEDLTQDEPKIAIDIEKMDRVFVNLIKNAFDAMPQGGKLTIKSVRTDDNVSFVFTDTGMGMTKGQMEKAWTPFFTTKAKGMGLGLPICKRIVEAHTGKISVESMAGIGTTFTVTIPIEPKPTEGGEKVWVNVPESLLSTTTKA